MGISSDVIRGYNDTIILCLLLDEPSYGYEISRKIRTKTADAYIIKETTLYSAFTRMEKNGYIESYPGFADNGKRRTYYRITDSGRQYYREKCEEWQLIKDVIERFIREENS
ncbi:MAG: PadR family transcriptional regulator [Lachnospiraceae bacterium]|jgi:PadR family transcriptional regulator PadR|nr:PadR family transcriptional regulator [Lachnospiraceae bacterium]MCI1328332.1 PadR family transcriptional regulator [Lachnospiraceae bacterium]